MRSDSQLPDTQYVARRATGNLALRSIFANLLLMIVSAVLLFGAGLCEAHRTSRQLQIDRLEAAGRVIQSDIERILKAGIPLKLVPGFETMSQPLRESDSSLVRVALVGSDGETLYSNPPLTTGDDHGAEDQSDDLDAVGLPLRDRFEKAGELVLYTRTSVVTEAVQREFYPLIMVSAMFIVLLPLCIYLLQRRYPRRAPLIRSVIHTLTFVAILVAISISLVRIYKPAIADKTRGLATTLQWRLAAPIELGIPLDALSGIDDLLRHYQKLHPELGVVRVSRDGNVRYHPDKAALDQPPRSYSGYYMYTLRVPSIHPSGQDAVSPGSEWIVDVGIPKSALYKRLWQALKNLLTLFVALILMLRLFQGLWSSLGLVAASDGEVSAGNGDEIKPFFALLIFMEMLNISFLPQFFSDVSQGGARAASILYFVYFAAFALSLVWAGRYAANQNARRLLYIGICLDIVGLLGLAVADNMVVLMIVRTLCGAGQGIAFIGAQTYLLRRSPERASSVIVLGFNVGVICGTALGGLLVLYTGPRAVFLIGAGIGLFNVLYAHKLLSAPAVRGATRRRGQLRELQHFVRDRSLLKGLVCVSLPTKAAFAGAILLCVPLLLRAQGYADDEVGQIMIFYALGVLVCNQTLPVFRRWLQRPETMLRLGVIGGNLSLLAFAWLTDIGFMHPYAKSACLVLSIALLGYFHGFIHAPILDYVVRTKASRLIGEDVVAALYRFLERLGHLMGPVVIGVLISYSASTSNALVYFATGTFVLGVVFVLLADRRTTGYKGAES